MDVHRAFSAAVAKEHGLYVEPRRSAAGGVAYAMNSRSFEDGYEVRAFAGSSLTVEAKPPLEEVQAFNQVRAPPSKTLRTWVLTLLRA